MEKRVIKFREYEPCTGVVYAPFALENSEGYFSCTTCYKEGCDHVFMQFTGLTDKHGKEIYEGDVVKQRFVNFSHDDIDNPLAEKTIERISFIEYRNHGFWVNAEDFGYEGEDLWDWNLIEVIGNIFEHPELITPRH